MIHLLGQTEPGQDEAPASLHKPSHGGYPGEVPEPNPPPFADGAKVLDVDRREYVSVLTASRCDALFAKYLQRYHPEYPD